MITGFNTDVEHEGRIYHIQTEDKGTGNPVIESLVYLGGEILASRRTSYADLAARGAPAVELSERLEAQHRRMVLDVRQGRHDPGGMKAFGEGIISERGFEQVVLDYLARDLATENLQVTLEEPSRFESGRRTQVVLRAKGEITSLPVAGVRLELRLLSPVEKPRILLEGNSDRAGVFRGTIDLPPIEAGSAALVVRARLGDEVVELKWMVEEPSKP
ncbi:MAG TPA: hypothetical protein VFW45_17545 [Candidatus Polarisedimenticolia bacterium]|nr:hypothetical protein [Candidatus Polarisedimenticolia bacterium]